MLSKYDSHNKRLTTSLVLPEPPLKSTFFNIKNILK
jgi:hypothetical protein